ncbi:ABC transport permease subunit MlaE [Planctomycetes bacterium Poly30]|uniref:ABC transport permease subunit MlaE n=1 Tax=Saltatorellus ferox TaxID=2528018 RepID=A0A518EUP3_9BACT|nr:ABC transport permease subunit MlaE [Planctomycetes bacterium Poly30]
MTPAVPSLAIAKALQASPPEWAPAWLPDALPLAFVAGVLYVLWQLERFREAIGNVGSRIDLAWSALVRVHHLPKRLRWFFEQLYQSGIQNLHVVLLVGLFMGMIVSLQTGIELARFGQEGQIGTIVAASMTREMGPFITAIVLAATTGSALAAELGTMSVSDELAALDVMSVDKVSFLVLPRIAALMIIGPVLTVLCDTIGIFGGGFVATSQLGVGWSQYTTTAISALQEQGGIIPVPMDVYAGLLKSIVFGAIIAVISCASGLEARGGALGVGRATSRAVRDSIIAVIVANYFLTFFLYR